MANTHASDALLHSIYITSNNPNSMIWLRLRDAMQPGDPIYVTHDSIWTHKTKHILDIKYPHVCFKCKKSLCWKELYAANCDGIVFNMPVYKRLKKLWRSKVIEFYCCECYADFFP